MVAGVPNLCPTFYPTKEEFQRPFAEYVSEKFRAHPDIPMFKVSPPKEWLPRSKPFPRLDLVNIQCPIKQLAFGTKGAYRCVLMEQKPLSVSEFRKLANDDNHKYVQRERDSDDTMMERAFWSSVTINPPLYGADTPCSFFDEKLPYGWNLRSLGDLLATNHVPDIPGVTSPMTYFGMWKSFFAWHVEDADLLSINYLHFGASKVWYCVPPSQRQKFESMACSLFPELKKNCHAFMRHKDILFSPSLLRTYNIDFTQAKQEVGEFVVLNAGSYHAGFNHGFNCAEAVNFATEDWIPLGRTAKACQCTKDCVRIDMSIFRGPGECSGGGDDTDSLGSSDGEREESGSEDERSSGEEEEEEGEEGSQVVSLGSLQPASEDGEFGSQGSEGCCSSGSSLPGGREEAEVDSGAGKSVKGKVASRGKQQQQKQQRRNKQHQQEQQQQQPGGKKRTLPGKQGTGEKEPEAAPRKRGRPKGSKNKPKSDQVAAKSDQPPAKKRKVVGAAVVVKVEEGGKAVKRKSSVQPSPAGKAQKVEEGAKPGKRKSAAQPSSLDKAQKVQKVEKMQKDQKEHKGHKEQRVQKEQKVSRVKVEVSEEKESKPVKARSKVQATPSKPTPSASKQSQAVSETPQPKPPVHKPPPAPSTPAPRAQVPSKKPTTTPRSVAAAIVAHDRNAVLNPDAAAAPVYAATHHHTQPTTSDNSTQAARTAPAPPARFSKRIQEVYNPLEPASSPPAAILGFDEAGRKVFWLVQQLKKQAGKKGYVSLQWLKEGGDGMFRACDTVWEEDRRTLLAVRTQFVEGNARRQPGYKLLTLRSRIMSTELVD